MKKAIACAIVAGLASSASAGLITPGEVNLTYASPAGPKTVVYTAPGAGESFGTITVSTAVTLTVDLSGVGGSVVTFDNARVQMSASVTTANEVAPFGVTVNCALPGYTVTDRLIELAESISADKGIPVEEVRDMWSATIPMGRLGEPREFAALVAFLASDRASYITGRSITVDGGRTRGLL